MPSRTIVYSGLGNVLEAFSLDLATGVLRRVQSLSLPAQIQYAWPNRARTILYIAVSNAGPTARVKRAEHFIQAFVIRGTGTLAALGAPVQLGNRPLHLSLDREEAHLLVAYNEPSDVTVHKIAGDGSIGDQVPQQPMDFGVTVHQVRVTPAGTVAIVPACAHHPRGEPAGSVGVFSYGAGRLAPLSRMIADPMRAGPWQGVLDGGQGFSARHVDFHPTRPWMYLCVEQQGEIRLYDYDEAAVTLEARCIASTLEGTPPGRSSQYTGAIHVHPSGRFAYVSNRARDTEPVSGADVFVGGVNDIAVFRIDQATGEPTLIQHADTNGIYPRTFGIDASGRMLVAGNQEPGIVRDGDGTRKVLPSLAVFRIGDDGRLTFLHKHDHPDNGDEGFWTGVVSLPTRRSKAAASRQRPR
jgi:6-phosphogluconolactonase (cycloisomerase 2 family)